MANITAHALPSGDGEKTRVDDPTNDPRPLFRHTRTSNSVTNPPFTRKSNPSRHKQAKREEKNNIEKSQHRRSQRATYQNADFNRANVRPRGTRESYWSADFNNANRQPVISKSHTQQPHPNARKQSGRERLFKHASKDEHGQHYRSYATEW